jgi:hypothetical protein
MTKGSAKAQTKYEKNLRSGGNMGAGKSGREDLGSETTAEEKGSHKPGTATRRDANNDNSEQKPGRGDK